MDLLFKPSSHQTSWASISTQISFTCNSTQNPASTSWVLKESEANSAALWKLILTLLLTASTQEKKKKKQSKGELI